MEHEGAYTVSMSPDKARELVESGGTLLLLEVPEKTFIGIDQKMFVVGPLFKGIKMIPPGTHFVYYSAISKQGNEVSPITGFFVHFHPHHVAVRRWNHDDEKLEKLSDESEEERFISSVFRFEFDSQLGPYDVSIGKSWRRLANYISPAVIHRHEPVGGDISIVSEAEVFSESEQTEAEKRLKVHLESARATWRERHGGDAFAVPRNPDVPPNSGVSGRCFFTPLPRLVKNEGMSAEELTEVNLDKSKYLELLLSERYEGEEAALLGELQFTFVAFLMGQSLEAFGQWKALVHLMCKCFHAPLHTRTKLFTNWLQVLCAQLKFGLQSEGTSQSRKVNSSQPWDSLLDASWLSEDNFLKSLFTDWFSALREAEQVDTELIQQAKKLRCFLEEMLGWQLIRDPFLEDLEDDEYAPVVVQLD